MSARERALEAARKTLREKLRGFGTGNLSNNLADELAGYVIDAYHAALGGEGEAVAWGAQDYQGGWIPFRTESEAQSHANFAGNVVAPLYSAEQMAAKDARIADLEAQLDSIFFALEGCEQFGFDPTTGFIHANDGGAPKHCAFYMPIDDAQAKIDKHMFRADKAEAAVRDLIEALSNARVSLVAFGGDPRKFIQEHGSASGDEVQAALLDQIDAALKTHGADSAS